MYGMASHEKTVRPTPVTEHSRGRVLQRNGRTVSFVIQHHWRYRKQLCYLVAYSYLGEHYDGYHIIPEWLAGPEEALRRAKERFPAARGGFTYPYEPRAKPKAKETDDR